MDRRVLGTVLIRTSKKTGRLFAECQDNLDSYEFREFLSRMDPDYAKQHNRYFREDSEHQAVDEYNGPVAEAVREGRFSIYNRKGKPHFSLGTVDFNRKPVNKDNFRYGDTDRMITGARYTGFQLVNLYQYTNIIPKKVTDLKDKIQCILDHDTSIYGVVSPTGELEYSVPQANNDKPWWQKFISNQTVIAVRGQKKKVENE